MSAPIARRRKRKLKSEINVVPYIDVMLVLLVIFMITAPLLNLGVDVDLPNSRAKSINTDTEPVVVQVFADGTYAITLAGEDAPTRVDEAGLKARVGAIHKQNADAPILVAGQGDAPYQRVMDAIDHLRDVDVKKVSLLTNEKGGR